MSYTLILALHLVAVSSFIGGLMMVALVSPGFGTRIEPERAADLHRLLLFNRWAVTPALGCVWLLGLTMATEVGWFAAPWLQVKIVFVALLSGLHGIQSRRLGRLSRGTAPVRALPRRWPLLLIAVVATIVGLATDKPILWGYA